VVPVLHWLVTVLEAQRMFLFFINPFHGQNRKTNSGTSKNNSYFAAYEVTKKALTPAGSSPSELNLGAIIVAGGTAGVAMWALAIPPDVCFHGVFAVVLRTADQ
jgi:hypothetical protein